MSYPEHALTFTVSDPGDAPRIAINGRPAGDVLEYALLVTPRVGARLQARVARRDADGSILPRRDADGNPVRKRYVVCGPDGEPIPDAEGQVQFAEGEPEPETEILTGYLRLTGALEASATMQMRAENYAIAEALLRPPSAAR